MTTHPVRRSKRNRASWSWSSVGQSLVQSEDDVSWTKSATSFSAHVKETASTLGIDASALWRAVTAVRFYQGLGGEFEGVELPPIAELEDRTSPEILELIQRHSRVAPKTKVRELLEAMIEGNITRRSLQESWKIYKPSEAANNRGRRKVGEKFDPLKRTPISSREQEEAKIVNLLNEAGAHWTGLEDVAFYHLELRPRVEMPDHFGKIARIVCPDAIAVVQEASSSETLLHGIEAVELKSFNEDKFRYSNARASNYHYYWIAVHADGLAEAILEELVVRDLNLSIGVLLVNETEVRPIRNAVRQNGNEDQTGQLAARLLASKIKTR